MVVERAALQGHALVCRHVLRRVGVGEHVAQLDRRVEVRKRDPARAIRLLETRETELPLAPRLRAEVPDKNLSAPVEDVIEAYKDFYKDAAFTHYCDKSIDLKQVVNTNKALVHVEKYGNKLLVTSAIDNLLKGAVGQAVQNMNIMFGIDETAGLKLKASAF